jgi:hypothetical protein
MTLDGLREPFQTLSLEMNLQKGSTIMLPLSRIPGKHRHIAEEYAYPKIGTPQQGKLSIC